MYLNYVYDLDRHGGLVTAEPHWARKENAHAVVSVRKAGKEMKEMTHTYIVYVQLTKKGNICLVGNRLLLWLLARVRVLGGPEPLPCLTTRAIQPAHIMIWLLGWLKEKLH